MRIGLHLPSFTWPGGAAQISANLIKIAQTADEAGFASLWVMDHFFQVQDIGPHHFFQSHGLGPVEEPMLESYSTLSFLAALTRRVRLGTLVTGAIYRHPGILAKTVTTLDVLSGGRASLGIGAAWNEREARGLGIPFPPVQERFERLEEVLQILLQMWSGEVKPYQGKHFQLAEPLNYPLPLSQPHPPLLIGGMGEHKTLRLVAQYADACNLFARFGADVLRAKLALLRGYCEECGRPYDAIKKTALARVHLAPDHMTPQQVIEQCRQLAHLGFQQVIVNMPNVAELTLLDIFACEIIPAIAEL
jgi:F420-dependent oxidoreductase-like protein